MHFKGVVSLVAAVSMAGLASAAPVRKPAPNSPATQAAKQARKPAAVPARLYDFKGVALGISLDEFRKLPHPDGADARVVCTGEKVGKSYASEPTEVMLFDESEREAHVTKCVWYGMYKLSDPSLQKYLSDQVLELKLAASGYSTIRYSFNFVPDETGTSRLYQFEATSNRNAADAVIEALTGKFGGPKLARDTVQNGMGNSFDRVTALWVNPASSISVTDRFTKIDEMAIFVTHTKLNQILKAKDEARKKAQPNPI